MIGLVTGGQETDDGSVIIDIVTGGQETYDRSVIIGVLTDGSVTKGILAGGEKSRHV